MVFNLKIQYFKTRIPEYNLPKVEKTNQKLQYLRYIC